MKFIIIGGDAAGMSAASRAKRSQPDLDVTVLEKSRDVSYSACGMPYNIADPDRVMDDLVVRDVRTFREKQGIRLLTEHRADRIDPVDRTVAGETMDGKAFVLNYATSLAVNVCLPIQSKSVFHLAKNWGDHNIGV